ncbi:MAG TPA: DUF4136 domain-containing protein [Nitrospira sp.]|nr:DUF4136 domain-containing protein [Nitrospira sp.]
MIAGTHATAGPLACLLIVLAACISIDVKTEHDPAADFSRFKTFAFAERPVAEESGIDKDAAARDRIESALARELTNKDLRPVRLDQRPDLTVYYAVAVNEKLRKAWRTGYGWGARYGGGQTTYPYEEGTLIVDLVDPVKRELMWRATMNTHLEDTSAGRLDQADRAIARAFERYPPRTQAR